MPLALVATSLLTAEWVATQSAAAVALDLALITAFVLISPALFRWLSVDASAAWGAQILGWVIHVLVATGVVAVIGVLVPPLVGIGWTYISEPRSLGVLVVLFVVGGWGLGRDIELSLGAVRERDRADRLALEAEHARILALRAQLDPHFLFNTLNAIAEWCREDAAVAEAATLELATILRTIFDARETKAWSLGREVALLEQLGELYAARDATRYAFDLAVDEEARALDVPPLVLLPLFENAIKHGPAAGHAGRVSLVVKRAADRTTIEIRNPGTFTGKRDGGHGIAIVERRLALTYGARAILSIEAAGAETVSVLHLPSDAHVSRAAV